MTLFGVLSNPPSAYAVEAPVELGVAETFSVLGGQSVTNTGETTLSGDLGVSPGTSITGFPPGTVGGTIHQTDAVAAQAQADLTVAYDDAAGRAPTGQALPADLVGLTLVGGVYAASGATELNGTLTLDGQGDPNTVWIFQIPSTLITGSASVVNLINGARACNVFWQVGSSATLGTNSDFVGTIMALTSITVNTGADVRGRALARNGSVTLDDNTFTTEVCDVVPTTTTTTDTTTTTTGTTTTTTDTTTPTTTTTGVTTTTTPTTTTTGVTTTTTPGTTTTGVTTTTTPGTT
ncbi:ice-binding family protein, partial [Actinosynnema sp. NPDC023658]|uniref:ice-binding family protein n=1 Tax=Actinosynnema sp. NPDC023658 TaxID=3155465 RepID=UPI0034035897